MAAKRNRGIITGSLPYMPQKLESGIRSRPGHGVQPKMFETCFGATQMPMEPNRCTRTVSLYTETVFRRDTTIIHYSYRSVPE